METYTHTGKGENFELYGNIRKRWSENHWYKTRDNTGFDLLMICYWNDGSHNVCVYFKLSNLLRGLLDQKGLLEDEITF